MDAQKTRWYQYLALSAILGVALFFRVYNINSVGYGNLYYASTVFSMMTSLKNFFFASFDPAGFVTVDKPPLGFMIQAISASIFGFEGWALLLPEIVAGVLSCLVLYWLVRRYYSPNAGLIAALILAVTPIAVATDRNNTIDALLMFTLLLSSAAVVIAAEKGSLKWLLVGAVLIGLGFNIKQLQAFMILPAFYGLYILAAKTTWFKRFAHLALASLVIVVISFAWVAAVDLTPADQRPYVGSSENNTEVELIAGHNGLERMGQIAAWFGLKSQNGRSNDELASQPPSNLPPSNQNGFVPQGRLPFPPPNGLGPNAQIRPPLNVPNQPNGPVNNDPMGNETGTASLTRLLNEQLVGQVSWLLPLALFMIAALALRSKWMWPLDQDMQFALFWGLWLIPMAIFFSYAGLFHRYYLEMLAPAVAALTSAGLVTLCNDFIENRWQGWLLPAAILASAVFESAMIIVYFAGWAGWLVPLILLFAAAAALGLVLMRLVPPLMKVCAPQMLIVALVALLAAPVLWSTTPLFSSDTGLPYAGPELVTRANQVEPRNNLTRDATLVNYLQANYNGEEFLAATQNANSAAPLILLTGKPAMAMGGFSGSDPILTAQEFAEVVAQGKVRFVLLNDDRRGGQEIARWVQTSCVVVDPALWRGTPNAPVNSGPGGQATLYDCK